MTVRPPEGTRMGQLHLGFEIAALSVLVVILLVVLLMVIRRPHLPAMKECAAWIGFYVSLAVIFAVVLFFVGGMEPASEFVTGWLLEYSLSIDNLFVFIVIMAKFAVPKKYQQEVRSEEHTSELQSRFDLVCRLLLEKKKIYRYYL